MDDPRTQLRQVPEPVLRRDLTQWQKVRVTLQAMSAVVLVGTLVAAAFAWASAILALVILLVALSFIEVMGRQAGWIRNYVPDYVPPQFRSPEERAATKRALSTLLEILFVAIVGAVILGVLVFLLVFAILHLYALR